MPAAVKALTDQQSASKSWKPDKDEQGDLSALDIAIARMKHVTALDPYVLTIPQDVEPRYHHPNRVWAEQWLHNAPFERYEHESLQYQTFFFHEHGKDIYVLQPSRPPVDHPVTNESTKVRHTIGANTPNLGPKKTISLDAYKKKQGGATTIPDKDLAKRSDGPVKQSAVKGPTERLKAETEEILATVAESEYDLSRTEKNEQKSPRQKDVKRKREDDAQSVRKVAEPGTQVKPGARTNTYAPAEGIEPPIKRAKTFEGKSAKHGGGEKVGGQNEQRSRATEKTADEEWPEHARMPPRLSPGMPPRLSPGMPERLSPLNQTKKSTLAKPAEPLDPVRLPSRLSPTIPENIAKTLEARANFQLTPRSLKPPSAPTSTAKDKDGKLTPLKKPEGITKHKSSTPRNGFRANSSSPAVLPGSEDRTQSMSSITKAKSPLLSHDDGIAFDKTTGTNRAERQGIQAFLVKVKYEKTRREAVQRILRLPPKPDKTLFAQLATISSPEESSAAFKTVGKRNGEHKEAAPVKGVAQKIGPVKKDKRPKLSEDMQPAVEKPSPADDEILEAPTKHKSVEASETRTEPFTPAPREMDSPLAQRSAQQATPGTRKDLLSVAMGREQSQDSVATHSTPPAHPSTPVINNASSQPSRPPSSQPSSKTTKQMAWEMEQKRLETLGRELKHAASAHLSTSQSDPLQTSAEQRLAAVKCIESFLCYLVAFTCADEAALAADPRQSPTYKPWRSLHGFFAFVKRNSEPFPPLLGLTCCLGVVFCSRILEIVAQFPADGPGRESILETQKLLQKSAATAEAKLDIDALQDAFPKTWSLRTKKALAADKLEPSQLGGPFKLPIGVATTPIRAARAGFVMLQEWMEREKIEYHLKLKL